MGLKITVYRNEHEGRDGKWYSYATPASSKNESGGWDSEWLDVVFVKGAKGTVLENKTRIDCTDCFLGARSYMGKGGEKVTVGQVVVMEYELVGDPQPYQAEPSGFTALTEEDVPF